MNRRLETLAEVVEERQAEMRQVSQTEVQLRAAAPPRKERLTMKQKFALALLVVALLAFAIAQAAAASGFGGGGAGPLRVM